jgi:hypothetical protein
MAPAVLLLLWLSPRQQNSFVSVRLEQDPMRLMRALRAKSQKESKKTIVRLGRKKQRTMQQVARSVQRQIETVRFGRNIA